jgi:hypothetical protein
LETGGVRVDLTFDGWVADGPSSFSSKGDMRERKTTR